ncbi:UDP-galactopyranose mutase [Clostridioides sp. ES-S-0123-01]|uniref:UDP-galactopyranose mutase n=1 Tax=Clostridioides sp. ES-S-0123-01 TaxID=2770783 RepID=UPI001D12C1AF|nr:UDP-galactopyranose mutase [Clostridioides sp. ES-S-0123-01]
MKYDYLIVGSGLYASVFAHEAYKRGKKCLVIEKRNHIGGNIYCEKIDDINVHKYGAHIFHTSNKKIWEYINQFAEFNNFVNSPIAIYKNQLYNLPFNMNTFNKLWGIVKPEEAKQKIESQIEKLDICEINNLEEQALSLVGTDVYEKLIKGYTEKQWGRDATELPSFIIKRIPLRFTYNNNYFNDKYQGIPIGGYTNIIKKLLEGIEVKLETDFFKEYRDFEKIAKKLLFTGMIDEYFNYEFGALEYRSLRFEHENLSCKDYQGNAVVNYTEKEIPYTRIIEHKHFEFGNQLSTIITREYPKDWKKGDEPYYPINNDINESIFQKYNKLSRKYNNVIFGGRLGCYKYYDMDKVIEAALEAIAVEFGE